MTTIAALNPDTRPRERLVACGATQLSDHELLAIVLGSGTAGRSVIEVASALLAASGDLAGVAQASLEELRAQRGIGIARASLIQAAMELGRRAVGERPKPGRRLASAGDVWSHLRARLAMSEVEEFWALALDVRHRIQTERCLARGSLTGVEVHPRDVFRPLIRSAAAAVIFCHNHPSGDPTPSRQDVELTARLREVGELCGIAVLDHVVVGWEGFASLAERNWR
ncbi:MAG TPA: DNA repair protein RadC [Polyangia bacterium]|jgi:DNA repair protein RadC|nr:DNA repair protein RadC [Polyangia bacterium]